MLFRSWLQPACAAAWYGPRELRRLLWAIVRLRIRKYFQGWTQYSERRGMSRWHDYVDWLGGYPFEVARPDEIVELYSVQGFALERLKTVGGGQGCNEFVFRLLDIPAAGESPGRVPASLRRSHAASPHTALSPFK